MNDSVRGWNLPAGLLPIVCCAVVAAAPPDESELVPAPPEAAEVAEAVEVPEVAEAADAAEVADVLPEPADAAGEDVAETEHLVSWLHSFDRARELGRTRRTPILVIAGASWCGPCRQLEEQLVAPEVQSVLERCVAVHVDVDDDPESAELLAVSSIPALRILSPDGRLLASQEGYLSSDQLADWILQQLESEPDSAESQSQGKLTALKARRLMRQFRSQEATVRESAISRLADVPKLVAPFVVAAMADGSLSEQLSCLELLMLWDAPVEGVDPWVPESLTEERLSELQSWLDASDFDDVAEGDELSVAELIEVERLLRAIVESDPVAAAAIREQLARRGSRCLPLILDALDETSDEVARERLNAARYRVVADPRLEQRWPGGIERLASADYETRVSAANDLARRAARQDDALLAELLRDPMPLIREIGLSGLARTGRESASKTLAGLLNDPDANVRAAVLKQLAEQPDPRLTSHVTENIETETDPDLVVHAVRFLREVSTTKSVHALTSLLKHSSWRVRAEAADAIETHLDHRDVGKKLTGEPARELRDGLLELLSDEDDFVALRAVQALGTLGDFSTVGPLIEIAEQRDSLAPQILKTLSSGTLRGDETEAFLRAMCTHESPVIRSTAVTAVVMLYEDDADEEITGALFDSDSRVRVAAVDALFEISAVQLEQQLRQYQESTVETGDTEWESYPESSVCIVPDIVRGVFGGLFSGGDSDTETATETELVPDAETGDLIVEIDGSENAGDGDPVPADVEAAETDGAVVSEEGTDATNGLDQFIQQTRLELAADELNSKHIDSIRPMLEAEDGAERMAAARWLTILGIGEGFPALLQAAADPALVTDVLQCQVALTWDEKTELFETVIAGARSDADRLLAAGAVTGTWDTRTPQLLWPLLAEPSAGAGFAGQLHPLLRRSYFSEYFYSLDNVDPAELQRMTEDCDRIRRDGTEQQRPVALALLAEASPQSAISAAEELLAADGTPANEKNDALRVFLFSSEEDVATARAIETLTSEQSVQDQAESAICYLALEHFGVRVIAGAVTLQQPDQDEYVHHDADEVPEWIMPRLPDGITADHVRPFEDSEDADVRLSASYLMCLAGQPGYLDYVVESWIPGSYDDERRRLVYRAIAASNDPQYVPVLEQVYREMAEQDISSMAEFYWTIRSMTGPDILALRKRIRHEVDTDWIRHY